MTISFLEGSPLTGTDLEKKVKKRLKAVIREESDVTFLFYAESRLQLLAEWVVRELQAAYPDKRLACVGVFQRGCEPKQIPKARYTRCIVLDYNIKDIRSWAMEQSDCVFCFMDLLLCNAGDRRRIYHYLTVKEKCVDLCTEEEQQRARNELGRMSWWQREALSGRLSGERKRDTARRLGVSRVTAYAYERSAMMSLLERLPAPEHPQRRCAVFGLSARTLPQEKRDRLMETLLYLIQTCGVTHFILSGLTKRSELAAVLQELETIFGGRITIEYTSGESADIPHDRRDFGARLLAERRYMTDLADIILCDIPYRYRTGLNHAHRRQVPVINLEEL